MIEKPHIEIIDKTFEKVLIKEEKLEKLCQGAIWGEGPLWIEEQQQLIWSDIPNNRILSWSKATGMTVWKDRVNFTNGRYRCLNGKIVHCSHGGRSLLISDIHGNEFETLVNEYHGRKLNSPNDVIVKSDGSIWFTDPPYGILSDDEGYKADSELIKNYVFRFDPKHNTLDIVTDLIEEPNGLAFSVDESVLYISDTSCVLREDGTGNHHIMKFDVVQERSLKNPEIFAEITPGISDGFRVDINDWVYTSSKDSIQVYHQDGHLLGKIIVPEEISNCTFGGSEKNELFITATTSLYRIKLNTQGLQ